MEDQLTRVRVDKARARTLGWDVYDGGHLLAMRPGDRDMYVLSLLGHANGNPVHIHITYRESARTGVFRFHGAEIDGPGGEEYARIATQARTWELVEAYTPAGPALTKGHPAK